MFIAISFVIVCTLFLLYVSKKLAELKKRDETKMSLPLPPPYLPPPPLPPHPPPPPPPPSSFLPSSDENSISSNNNRTYEECYIKMDKNL